jgi:pimeloyl-ACP methyl ester carboxylesterase
LTAPEEFDLPLPSGRLHAQRYGDPEAPLVLCIPGLSGNIKNFDFVGERVGGGSLQLVALDLRGRGRSETTPAGTYGWENHARDVLAVADALGFESFAAIGQSMGGSVVIKVAELDGARLDAVVLVDVAGRVDRGVGAVIASSLSHLGEVFESVEQYLDAMRARGLIEPWTEYWQRSYCYELEEVDGGVRSRASREAVLEDRAYTATQDPYDRWKYLTMPTLLLRGTQELQPGTGYVVPTDDRERFLRAVRSASVVDVDANHLTINTHAATAAAIREFL